MSSQSRWEQQGSPRFFVSLQPIQKDNALCREFLAEVFGPFMGSGPRWNSGSAAGFPRLEPTYFSGSPHEVLIGYRGSLEICRQGYERNLYNGSMTIYDSPVEFMEAYGLGYNDN